MGRAIYGSVGHGGNNHHHDVIVVQLLLNNARYGEDPELRVDGDCGPLTIAAISNYQSFNMYAAHADGVIYPNCGTIHHLLGISSVNHYFLIRNYHKIQKQLSPRSYPVANVDDIAPLRPKIHAALQTPEAHVDSAGKTGHTYTDNPLEVPRAGTEVNPLTLPDLLQKAWPKLNSEGGRVMTAQYLAETRGGKRCWNYNLGNLKCSARQRDSVLHQYLANAWENWLTSRAEYEISTNKNARWPTSDEIKGKVGKESEGHRIVFYKPPDIECCFLAFKTLDDAIVYWTNRYKKITLTHSDFLDFLNKGDCVKASNILHSVRYYTMDQTKYTNSMVSYKKMLDTSLNKKPIDEIKKQK